MNIVEKEISSLKPYEKNAKTHPKKQVDLLAKNIEKFGFTTPVLINENDEVIAGHGRLLAMKQLNRDSVPCVRIEGLTESEVKALRLADNKIAELGEWDMDLAIAELKELGEDELDLTGFDKDLIIEPDDKDDEVPETPEEPKSKLGDLYELGEHRVLCGDSTKLEDVERLMDGKKADMVFTDPPYNFEGEGAGFLRSSTANMRDRVKDIIDFEPTSIAFIKEIDVHNFLFFCNKALVPQYLDIFKGFNFDILVWHKTNPTPFTSNGFLPDIEYLLMFTRKGRTWNNSLKPTSVYSKVYSSAKLEGREGAGDVHPTMKPIKLLSDKMRVCSSKNGGVLDLFLGSGSTLIAAEKTGRICYGMELDPKYIDVIVQRYIDYTGNENIIKNGEQIIWKKSEKLN
jgi:DNA modification methylase